MGLGLPESHWSKVGRQEAVQLRLLTGISSQCILSNVRRYLRACLLNETERVRFGTSEGFHSAESKAAFTAHWITGALKRGVGSREGERPKGKATFQAPSNLPLQEPSPGRTAGTQMTCNTALCHHCSLLSSCTMQKHPPMTPCNQPPPAQPHLLLQFFQVPFSPPFPFKCLACTRLVSSLQMVLPTSFSPAP